MLRVDVGALFFFLLFFWDLFVWLGLFVCLFVGLFVCASLCLGVNTLSFSSGGREARDSKGGCEGKTNNLLHIVAGIGVNGSIESRQLIVN